MLGDSLEMVLTMNDEMGYIPCKFAETGCFLYSTWPVTGYMDAHDYSVSFSKLQYCTKQL